MQILWLIVAVLTLSGGNILSGLYSKKVKCSDVYVYTLFSASAGMLFFFAVNGFSFVFHTETLLYAMLFALCYLCAVMFYILALKRGPLSITALVYSYALIVPTLFGIVFYKDATDALFYIAFALLLISLFLINVKPKGGENLPEDREEENGKGKKANFLWGIFLAVAFLGNGFCSVVQSYHQRLFAGAYKSEFMIFALLAVMLVNCLFVFCLPQRRARLSAVKRSWYWGACGGVINAALNLSTMMIVSAGSMPLSLLFPVEAAGNLIIVYLFSLLALKEKLCAAQHAGFVFGMASIILFNI